MTEQEHIEELVKKRSELFDEIERWKALRDSPQFSSLMSHLRERMVGLRRSEFATIIDTQDKVLTSVGLRVEIAGLQYSLTLLDALVETCSQEILSINMELEQWQKQPNQ